MRLLRLDSDASDSVSLVEFRDRADVPPYAILSHTWLADEEEVLFKDMESATQESVQHKSGYEKILFCAKQALQDGLRFFWIDTCCIDKSSSAELTEAINSMYRWYKHAVKCYVYLVDVSTSDLRGMTDGDQNEEARSRLRRSRWFSRGWTLQELLAPKIVEFYTSEGICLGDRQTLLPDLHEVTGVPHLALYGTSLTGFSIQEKMGWAANRTTKREEDAAYCLLGILAIPMVPMYGEGRAGAFKRLFREMTVIAAIDLDVEIDLKLLRGYFEDLMHEDHLTVPIISRDVPSNSEEQRRSMTSYDRLVDVSMQPIEAVPSDTQTRTICEQQMEISPIRTQSQQNVRQTTNGVGDVDKAATLWTEAMARNLNSRLGYENVSVLLIKWADALDELKTRHEVSSPSLPTPTWRCFPGGLNTPAVLIHFHQIIH